MMTKEWITKEWIEEQIEKLEAEHVEAVNRLSHAAGRLSAAKAEYNSAKESLETIAGCIRGFKFELSDLGPEK